ncbi:hypothetical protein GQ54DRAFT_198152 [Martensiomyces pterosporus]|nr:hypothetical protein GQ54DRAFT_198152 [Martensiomyces pterosporus]
MAFARCPRTAPVRAAGRRAYASATRGAAAGPRPTAPLASRGDIEYCRQLVQQHDYDNYLVSLFTPRLAREAVWGIRAMNIELVHIAETTSSQTAAQMRYTYWINAVNSMYDGHPTQTPILRTVFDATQRFAISRTWLRRLVTEREKALAKPVFDTTRDVEAYGERAYACLIHPHLEALGVRDMHADNAARAIGQATAVMNFTRSLPRLLAQGKCDLPRDLLHKHGVDLADLYANPRPTPSLQEAVFEFATKGYTRLCGVAEIYVPSSPKEGFPALLAAVPVKDWLERLERANFNVFDASLQRHTLKVLWSLWRASRRGSWITSSNIAH